MLEKFFTALFALALFAGARAANVEPQNLKEGGEASNTAAIQEAIDRCSASGGGDVVFPSGVYLTGHFIMKDNVRLLLKPDTVILGSASPADYPRINLPSADADFNYTLIYAKGAKNIAIEGGAIRGQGEKFPRTGELSHHRPRNILFDSCENVSLKNLAMRSPAFWNAFFLHCDGVVIEDVNIYAMANANNDGLDISSKNVKIKNCSINAIDDGICLKNEHGNEFVVENVEIENCVIASSCNFVKIGTGSQSNFRNIKVSNCSFLRPSCETHLKWHSFGATKKYGIEKGLETGLAGIALEAVDGGSIDDVSIRNISMTGVQTPIFIRVDNRDRNNIDGRKSCARNISIENVAAVSDSLITSSITAVAGYKLENVKIKNCIFDILGGAPESANGNKISDPKKAYPENRMFGKLLPAYGFFVRNAENVELSNVQLITHGAPEFRHAVFAENSGLLIENCAVQKPAGSAPAFKFENSRARFGGYNIELDPPRIK